MNKLTLPAKLAALERANSCLVQPMAEVGELVRALEEREKELRLLTEQMKQLGYEKYWFMAELRRILEAR